MKKEVKWLIYTVLVSILPILSRFLVGVVLSKEASITLFNVSDFITFGLILHISVINEIENLNLKETWKTTQNGVSIIFISLYSVLFALSLMNSPKIQIVNMSTLFICVFFLSLVSLFISFSVFRQIKNIEG